MSRHASPSTGRLGRVAAATAVVLTAGLLPVLLTGTADAATIGALSFSAASGDSDQYVTVSTPTACPAAATNLVVLVTGGDPSTAGSQVNGQPIVGNSRLSSFSQGAGGGYTIPFTLTMREVGQAAGLSALKGSYTYTVRCRTSGDATSLGDFTGPLTWTPGSKALDATYFADQPTSTTLALSPASPQPQGSPITLTASVLPAGATGTVQFLDGTSKVGTPTSVSNVSATLTTTTLSAGTRSLTAVFTGSGPAFAGSTSPAVSYAISAAQAAFKPLLYGAAQVGSTPQCLAAFDYATSVSYQWLLDGAPIAGASAVGFAVPESAFGRVLSCRVTASNGDTAPISATSSAVKVAVGPALRTNAAPVVGGSVRKGQRISAQAGNWTPSSTALGFQWLRDGKPIAGATGASYLVSAADVGHLVSVSVQARRAGWTSTTVTAKAVKASA